MPGKSLTEVEGPDKVVHIILFAGFSVLWMIASPGRRWTILLAGLAYSIALEIMQSLAVSGRSGSMSDVTSDAIGLVIGVIAMAAFASWRDRKAVKVAAETSP
jgi:VanZ family protein